MKFLIALVTVLATQAAMADRVVENCDEAYVSLTSLVAPIAQNTRSFYNGQVHAYKIDHLEPACCSYGVAIVLPDANAELAGEMKCVVVKGLSGVDVRGAVSSYDPTKGLLLTFTTSIYDPNIGVVPGGDPLKLRINLRNSSVLVE